MGSRSKKSNDEHEVTFNLSVIQAVESVRREPPYYESTRNGKRKRVYESVKPLHHFHMEYQLTPGPVSPLLYQTDIVTYSVVAKIFTDQDERVVNVWKEGGLTYYGWKHSHKLKVTVESLLDLYDHTLTVRLWNTSDKLSPRARFDRPKAFRLPVPSEHGGTNLEEPQDSEGLIGGGHRPSHFPNVCHDAIPTRRSRRGSRRPSQMIECLEEGKDLKFDISPRKTFNISMVIEEGDESDLANESQGRSEVDKEDSKDKLSVSAPEGGLRSIKRELTASQLLSFENLTSSTSRFRGLSRRKLRQLQAEAEETVRIENEGLIVLSVRFADLFAGRDHIEAKIVKPVVNIKHFEFCLSLATPLMSERQCRLLNPMQIIIGQASNLPYTGHEYKPPFVKYRFYDKPAVCTPAAPNSLNSNPSWRHTQIMLLGTIQNELLLEYLRGPPLVIEVHDREKELSTDDATDGGAVFGSLWNDPLIGTCAYSKEVRKKSRSGANSFGVAYLDLSTLLDGLKVMEYTLPIINDQSKESDNVVKSCDYIKHGSQLTVEIKLSQPLDYFPAIANSTSPITTLRPLTPFGRIIFILLGTSQSLIDSLLSIIRAINLDALDLDKLPNDDTKNIALSTYKLTREQMTSDSCDVITGFHIDDGNRHYMVCEGLGDQGVKYLWDHTPHHHTQDPGVVNVFYNSEYTFSSRLYGNLDVDLTLIKLPQPLSQLVKQPLIHLRGNLPKLCFNCLMKINQMLLCCGLSDIVRNDYLPTPMMITALSLYCLQQEDDTAVVKTEGTQDLLATTSGCDEAVDGAVGGGTSAVSVVRRRRRTWEPLELSNRRYDALLEERKREQAKDFVQHNIVASKLLSDEVMKSRIAKSKRANKLHFKSLSEQSKDVSHLYSSQTFNSTVIGKEVLREQLDPTARYTYSQQYHNRTLEPPPTSLTPATTTNTTTTNPLVKGSDGGHLPKFVYPVMKTSLESNAHPETPHPARIEDLKEPFVDNRLHTSRLYPTVNRKQFKWNERESDFELYRPIAPDFGIQQPVTIHLAGQTRAKELKESEEKEQQDWKTKLVVDDARFHILRRSIKTESTAKGPAASTQLEKLRGLLKDEPKRVSYRPSEDLRVDNLPSLSLIRMNEDYQEEAIVGFLPGPDNLLSLKRNCNVVPLLKPVELPDSSNLHRKEFNVYCQNYQSLLQSTNDKEVSAVVP